MILDIIFAVIVIVCAYYGYKRGFVRSLCSTFSWIISAVVAYMSYNGIAEYISASPVGDYIRKGIADNVALSDTAFSDMPKILRVPLETGMAEAVNSVADTLSTMIICIISIIITMVLVKLLMAVLFKVLNVVSKLPLLRQFNKLLGVVSGAINGCFWTCLLILALTYISLSPGTEFINDHMDSSAVVSAMAQNSFFIGFFPDSK